MKYHRLAPYAAKIIFSAALIFIVLTVSGCKLTEVFSDLGKRIGAVGGSGKFAETQSALQTQSGKVKLTVELADTAEKREQGLMNREELEQGHGMWFAFEDEAPRTFWMKNTLIPLDILFFNGKKEIVRIIENMEPCKIEQCPSYYSGIPAMYALEVPVGFVRANSISLGDKIAAE